MELRHLRYFIAAAEEEHFGRASERLHVTRPAVSQLVSDLEDETGILLFERHAQGVKLTAAGRTLLPHLQAMMHDLSQALTLAKRVSEGKSGALSIGYGSMTLLHPLFRAAIRRFHETCPDVTLSLVEMPTAEQVKAIAEGKIHAGFMHFGPRSGVTRKKRSPSVLPQDETVLERLRIQSGGLGVAVPSDHPLARKRSVSLADLAGERFVVVPGSSASPAYGPLFALCQKAGFQPEVVQEVSSIVSQLNLVSVGMGIALVVTSKNFAYPAGLAVVPLNDVNYATTFVLGWLKGHTEPLLQPMIEIVKALAKDSESPAGKPKKSAA